MTSPDDPTVTVAPREISDLVYRVARCHGCSSGTADLIAENVRFGEVFYGGAIDVFLAAVADNTLTTFSTAPDVVLDAEVTTTTPLILDPPLPVAAFGATLWQSAQRDWVATNLDHPTLKAADEVSELVFTTEPTSLACDDAVAAVDLVRSVEGVDVAADSFAMLYDGAKAFLVAESVLDAAVPDEPPS